MHVLHVICIMIARYCIPIRYRWVEYYKKVKCVVLYNVCTLIWVRIGWSLNKYGPPRVIRRGEKKGRGRPEPSLKGSLTEASRQWVGNIQLAFPKEGSALELALCFIACPPPSLPPSISNLRTLTTQCSKRPLLSLLIRANYYNNSSNTLTNHLTARTKPGFPHDAP